MLSKKKVILFNKVQVGAPISPDGAGGQRGDDVGDIRQYSISVHPGPTEICIVVLTRVLEGRQKLLQTDVGDPDLWGDVFALLGP